MSTFMQYLICAVGSYLIGSVSSSILLSKWLFHRDVRSSGSGNAGAANVTRTFGIGAGALTFLGDFLKAFIAMWLCQHFFGRTAMAIGGSACLLGHCFPIYFHFRGGKAVSCGAAVALMLDWRIFVLALIVFLIAALLWRTASICSLCAAIAVGIGALVFTSALTDHLFGVFACVLVVCMHHTNIARIFHGTEPKFRAGSSSQKK